jgi:hypothetical protein
MRSAVVNSVIFLLTFLLGCGSAFLFPSRNKDSSDIPSNELVFESEISQDVEYKYGCRDEETVSFWEKLDKEHFLRQQRSQMAQKDPERADTEFSEFKRSFGCSYFLGVEAEDLNGDGIDELKVQGEGGMRDWPTYIFQQTDSGLRMILAEAWTFEEEHPTTTHHGFRDLVFHTNYTGSYREITRYEFNGRMYLPVRCKSEESMKYTKDDVIPVDTPIVKKISCRGRIRVEP